MKRILSSYIRQVYRAEYAAVNALVQFGAKLEIFEKRNVVTKAGGAHHSSIFHLLRLFSYASFNFAGSSDSDELTYSWL